MSLTKDDVVAQALTLLDEGGLPDLSMRRLATSLGIQPSALYWHVASKQVLLQEMARSIVAPVAAPGGDGWEARVLGWAQSLREALMSRRDAAELVASALSMRPAGLDPADDLAILLADAGLTPAEAAGAAATLLHFVLGHAVDEQGHDQMRQFGVAEQSDESADSRFDYGLELLVAGIGLALVRSSLGR